MTHDKTIDRGKASIRDVAEHFDVSERTVRRWMKTTDIPHRRIEDTIRFDLDELDEWSARGGASDEPAA